jgi:hypothetical protein
MSKEDSAAASAKPGRRRGSVKQRTLCRRRSVHSIQVSPFIERSTDLQVVGSACQSWEK